MTDTPAHVQLILEIEARIVRVRAAVRAGATSSEAVGEDLAWVQHAVRARLVGYARRLGPMGSLAYEETFEALNDRLLRDMLSPGYVSLETGFGAYLRTMPLRILQAVHRRHVASSAPVSLDAPALPDGLPRHELIADPQAEALLASYGAREALDAAIARLPAEERLVITWRLGDVENREIANRLGISPATATRIFQRAVERLRAALEE
jgi:RNA polymerase sigma factor (sigma-70 family)